MNLYEFITTSGYAFNNIQNSIFLYLVSMLLLLLIKDTFTIHMGPVCAYSNVSSILGIVAVLFILAVTKYYGIYRLEALPILLGVLTFIIFEFIIYKVNKYAESKAEEKYKSKRKLDIESIDTAKLKQLIDDCNEKDVELTQRACNCRCQFGDRKPSENSVDCISFDGEYTENPEECTCLFGCTDVKCSVFNTIVDYSTLCVWNEQDNVEDSCSKKCLLSKIESNQQLKELVESMSN